MASKWKKKGGRKHVALYEFMLKSDAWQDLTTVERELYVELKRVYDGRNNGRIALSCRDAAARLNVGKSTAERAFNKLQANGFIAVVKQGAFSVKHKVATEWRLTEYKCDVTGELPTREWQNWRPEKQNTVPSQTVTVPPQGQLRSEMEAKRA